eukprot:TRINITY_DN606_c1_g1_i5.p1 TRINITY_DN606_c1_g1~~TRINITY_DN606_c1_g1_i5.p1  ORF type:complete len:240 (+),score=49.85 TRINITY_DN606_c1_g1_i5:42-722(+)
MQRRGLFSCTMRVLGYYKPFINDEAAHKLQKLHQSHIPDHQLFIDKGTYIEPMTRLCINTDGSFDIRDYELYYVDDVARFLEQEGQEVIASLYADDMATVITANNLEQAQKKAQEILDRIDAWALSRRKTCYMTTGGGKADRGTLHFQDGNAKTKVSYDENLMFLGVRFDENVSFKANLEYVKGRLDERIRVMKALTGTEWGCMAAMLRAVNRTIVLPHWGSTDQH